MGSFHILLSLFFALNEVRKWRVARAFNGLYGSIYMTYLGNGWSDCLQILRAVGGNTFATDTGPNQILPGTCSRARTPFFEPKEHLFNWCFKFKLHLISSIWTAVNMAVSNAKSVIIWLSP